MSIKNNDMIIEQTWQLECVFRESTYCLSPLLIAKDEVFMERFAQCEFVRIVCFRMTFKLYSNISFIFRSYFFLRLMIACTHLGVN